MKCYEELEFTSESFLPESEVTVTDLEEESSEFSLESKSQNKGLSHDVGCGTLKGSGMVKLKTNIQLPATTEIGTSEIKVCSRSHDSLVMCQDSSSSPMVRTVADPISSKLAAIHHVSQAIKSLRWKRQLQNTQGELIDHGSKIHDRSSSVSFSLCACGDADCIEICDIREWLPKSRIDRKMWKLILLLGESYLSLGEAYKEDGQLHQTLKIVELACLLYGSMPKHLEDAQFISSITSSSACELKFDRETTYIVTDAVADLNTMLNEDACFNSQLSPTTLFWAKVWILVGDVYVEYYRINGRDISVQAKNDALRSEARMPNEVVKEVKRLKKKLGRYNQNCSTCSLMNCSCQSDRVSSGSSASSSSGDSSSFYYRKQSRKLSPRNFSYSLSGQTQDNKNQCKVGISISNVSESNDFQDNKYNGAPATGLKGNELKEGFPQTNVGGNNSDKDVCLGNAEATVNSQLARSGGIFKFLEGPKPGDVEYNLSAAGDCYSAASEVMDRGPPDLVEFSSVLKRWGWVSNELGRYRLEKKNLHDAEVAFADAIKAFKQVSDHANIILINCNLGHGRRALAEELIVKMEELRKYGPLQNAHKQAMKSAKSEYIKSLEYYRDAWEELNSVQERVDASMFNEVQTQYANTYLRYGMLLAKEIVISEGYDVGHMDPLLDDNKNKEYQKYAISASDAFRKALARYEALGELRKQETAFAQFQLACYYKTLCLKFLDLDDKLVNDSKCQDKNKKKAKWYASLAEKNWEKCITFYGPKIYPVMYLNILMELSSLELRLSGSLHINSVCHFKPINLFYFGNQ